MNIFFNFGIHFDHHEVQRLGMDHKYKSAHKHTHTHALKCVCVFVCIYIYIYWGPGGNVVVKALRY